MSLIFNDAFLDSMSTRGKHTYAYQFRSAFPNGVTYGVMTLVGFVATKALGGTAWHTSLPQVASMVGLLASGYLYELVKSQNRLRVVVWSWMAGAVGIIAMGIPTSATPFVLLGSTYFMLSSITIPTYTSILKSNYPDWARASVLGFIRQWLFVVGAAAALVAGFVLDRYPAAYRIIFPIAGLLNILGNYFFSRIRVQDEPAPRRSFSLTAGLEVLRDDRAYREYLLIMFVAWFSSLMMMPLIPVVLGDRNYLGVSYIVGALALSVVTGVLQTLTVSWWGRVADRTKPWDLQAIFMLAHGVTAFCLYVGTVFRSVIPFFAAAVIMGLFLSGLDIVWLLGPVHFAPKSKVAEYSAVNATLTGVRGVTASFLGATMSSLLGPEYVFWLAGLVMVLASYSMHRFARRQDEAASRTLRDGGRTDPASSK